VAGRGFVVGDVSEEVPHGLIFTRNRPSNLRFYCELSNSRVYSHPASASVASGRPCAPGTAS
jgi:hypothetical protein